MYLNALRAVLGSVLGISLSSAMFELLIAYPKMLAAFQVKDMKMITKQSSSVIFG